MTREERLASLARKWQDKACRAAGFYQLGVACVYQACARELRDALRRRDEPDDTPLKEVGE